MLIYLVLIQIFCLETLSVKLKEDFSKNSRWHTLNGMSELYKDSRNEGIPPYFVSDDYSYYTQIEKKHNQPDIMNNYLDTEEDKAPAFSNTKGEKLLRTELPFLDKILLDGHDSLPSKYLLKDTPNYWFRVKAIVDNMKSILLKLYPSVQDEVYLFSLFDILSSAGNYFNALRNLQNPFDENLLAFLSSKWDSYMESVFQSYPFLKLLTSFDTKVITHSILMSLAQGLGRMLQFQSFSHLDEVDFISELMKSSGFYDEEIGQVFSYLGIQLKNEAAANEGRQYSEYQVDKSDGYGHGGGGYMQYGGTSLDPFVVLAGLAFATFLAFLIFRLLSSTVAAGKRSLPDMSLTLDLSDMPEMLTNLYSWIEKAETKYGDNLNSDVAFQMNDISKSTNRLWRNFDVDRLTGACISRFLCDYSKNLAYDAFEVSGSIRQTALLSLAYLMGDDKSPRIMDAAQEEMLKGRNVLCHTISPQCGNEIYVTH